MWLGTIPKCNLAAGNHKSKFCVKNQIYFLTSRMKGMDFFQLFKAVFGVNLGGG